VKGSIPPWAAGSLYRTGPGQFNVEDTALGTYRTTHWFDGFGHSHRFDIVASGSDSESPVRVKYTSRRQAQTVIDEIRKKGRRSYITFGQRADVCVGIFSKITTAWRLATPKLNAIVDNIAVTVNANVPSLSSAPKPTSEPAGRAGIKNTWLASDNMIMKEMDQTTLEPLRSITQAKFHPLLKGPLSCAHAQRDPETGDFFNYNLEPGYKSTYRVFRINASSGTTDILATISGPDIKPSYIHSFFLSRFYVILCVPSAHIGNMGLNIPWIGNVVDAIEPFDESKLCKWFIVDRKGKKGVVATFTSPAGFFFHTINSFEEFDESTGKNAVFCDLIEYPTTEVIRSFEIDVLLQNNGMTHNFWGDETRNRNSMARFTRYKFCLTGGTVEKPQETPTMHPEKILEIKAPHVGELPTINPNYTTKKYRYVYSLPNRGHSTLLDTIVKTDLETRTALYWDNPKGHTPGEAIFVPRPKAMGEETAEDDGVLLSVILDGFGKTSYLVCLDARTLKELGRAECEWAVAFGFHGLHAPAAL
jgi:torulene dioxygenase